MCQTRIPRHAATPQPSKDQLQREHLRLRLELAELRGKNMALKMVNDRLEAQLKAK